LAKSGLHAAHLTAPFLLKETQLSLEPFELIFLGGPLLSKRLLSLLKEGPLVADRPLGLLNLVKEFEDFVLKFRAALFKSLDLLQNRCIFLIRLDLEETRLPLTLLRLDIFFVPLLTPTELLDSGKALTGLLPCPSGAG
jgi:hypothetical protein